MPKILSVEDSQFDAQMMQRVFANAFPDFLLTIVADAENAKNAVLEKSFNEWDFENNQLIPREGATFDAVFWDNQFPRTWGAKAENDVGIETAAALLTIDKVRQTVGSRFASASGDPAEKFVNCKSFSAIVGKPISIKKLNDCFRQWRLLY